MKSVAICIPTYNQSAYLESALDSALAQTHPCEIWVSDHASTDATPVVMARLLREHSHIKHFRQSFNLGMSGNPRWIVQQPTTDYIVKLDSDDELCPRYVETLLAELEAHPSAGYAHGAVHEINGQGQRVKNRTLARNTGILTGPESLQASVTGYRVAANICMFRRQALQQVDYYRTDLKFADDWDLAVRLADAGWGNIYVNDFVANYRVWDTPEQVRARRKLAEVQGCHRVFEESIVPAFQRRGWNLAPVVRARRQLALRHADCLRRNVFNEANQSDLERALCLLGDSRALRLKFTWIRTPMARVFEFQP